MYKQYYTLLLKGYSLKQVADMMDEEYEKVRKGIYRFARDNNLPTASEIQNLSFEGIETAYRITNKEKSEEDSIKELERKFTEEFTTKEDGEVTSTKLISQSDLASEESILLSHGINPEEFTLTSHRQSKWDNAGGEQRYSSRVTVKPKKLEITQEELLDKILSKIDKLEPYKIERIDTIKDKIKHKEKTLVIPLYDLHFQYTTEEQKIYTEEFYYDVFLKKVVNILLSEQPEDVVIIFGGDALEHDNFVFTTESGTRTDDTELDQDYVALFNFLDALISTILYYGQSGVSFLYVRGNHSPSMDWALSHALKQKYSTELGVKFDLSLDTLKHITVYDSFIGLKHGHINAREREADTLVYLNPKEYAECKYHYMFTGHYHRIKEYVVDKSSIYYIQFPSPAINNNWAKDLQFNSQFSGLRIMLFEPNQGITQDYYIRATSNKNK